MRRKYIFTGKSLKVFATLHSAYHQVNIHTRQWLTLCPIRDNLVANSQRN